MDLRRVGSYERVVSLIVHVVSQQSFVSLIFAPMMAFVTREMPSSQLAMLSELVHPANSHEQLPVQKAVENVEHSNLWAGNTFFLKVRAPYPTRI